MKNLLVPALIIGAVGLLLLSGRKAEDHTFATTNVLPEPLPNLPHESIDPADNKVSPQWEDLAPTTPIPSVPVTVTPNSIANRIGAVTENRYRLNTAMV